MKYNYGGVLIYVLLLLAMLSSLLSVAFQNSTNNTRLLAASLLHTEARQMALSGLDLIIYELKRDGRNSDTDNMQDRWYSYTSGRDFPIEGGNIFIQIQDAAAVPSLNQVIGYASSDEPYQEMLRRYTSNANLPSFNLDPVIDYIDADNETRSSGAEAWDYAGEDIPFIPRNDYIEGYADFALIQGIPEKLKRKAYQHFSLIPGAMEVNVNIASPHLLKAALTSAEGLDQAIKSRSRAPYETLSEFLKDVGLKKAPNTLSFGVSTEYFTVRSEVRYNEAYVGLEALVWRDELNFKVLKINWL
ncbi:MAG: type II secretion system minor pseudopilin GspK [Pseudomonadota bacterium]|nr:type II secretion system minor pseudopilin GspK [Pseudomonadota bacterium]